MAHDFG